MKMYSDLTIYIVSIGTLAVLTMVGCQPSPMPNEQIIAATQKCKAANMKAVPLVTIDRIIVDIQCEPKP